MANLENLKRFIDEPKEDLSTGYAKEPCGHNSQVEHEGNTELTDIEKNSKMNSPAYKLCNALATSFGLATFLLVILCFIYNEYFFGDGIKNVKIYELFEMDASTLRVNLMVRFAFLTFYMLGVLYIVDRITCQVCGNFFTGRTKIWGKYRGTDIDSKLTITTYDGVPDHSETSTTYYHNFDFLYQCKCCGNLYIAKETKKQHEFSRFK
jgi:hypothetical protein